MRKARSSLAVVVVVLATCAVHLAWVLSLRALEDGQTQGLLPDLALVLHRLWFFNAALWRGEPAFPGGAVLMFLSYGFIHGGWDHLLFNMVPLLPLGVFVTRRIGGRGFLALYFGAMIVSAGAYALTARPDAVMFGASGAVYGVAGASLIWAAAGAQGWLGRFALPALVILALVALNLWVMSGGIPVAWAVHVAGFGFGAVVALIWPRPADAAPAHP